jgi:hypothetical protein
MPAKFFQRAARYCKLPWFAWGLAVFAVVPAPAQTPNQLIQLMMSQPKADISKPVTATASFDPPLVRPGEKSVYRVTFDAASDATAVVVPWPDPMPVKPALPLRLAASGNIMQQTGGGLQAFSIFNFETRPVEPGIFTVPEFTVEVYGKPVVIPSATLEVRNTVAEPRALARELILEPAKTNVFVGENFNVRVLLPGGPDNRIETLSQVDLKGDGFFVQRNAIRQTIQMMEYNGRKSPTYIYETSVMPVSTGALKLGAQGFTSGLQFNGPVTITGQATIAGGAPRYVLLNAGPVTIHVRPLPPGELPGFTGAVGSYSADLPALATNKINVGDAVALRIVIRGGQNPQRTLPPPAPHDPDWQIFPAERGPVVPGITGPGATFTYTLIPLTTNVLATPAIPFSSFDPDRGEYVDLTIPPVAVTVLGAGAAADADAALMIENNAGGPETKTGLSRLASSPGFTADSLVPLQMRVWFPLVQLLPVWGFCGLWAWDRRRRYLEQHPEIVRRQQARRALRRELRRLDRAVAAGDAAVFIRCGINALQIVSAPRYPAEPRALVCRDVLEIFSAAERAGKAGETVRRFFAAADAAAFADATGAGTGLLAEAFALKQILATLEARL